MEKLNKRTQQVVQENQEIQESIFTSIKTVIHQEIFWKKFWLVISVIQFIVIIVLWLTISNYVYPKYEYSQQALQRNSKLIDSLSVQMNQLTFELFKTSYFLDSVVYQQSVLVDSLQHISTSKGSPQSSSQSSSQSTSQSTSQSSSQRSSQSSSQSSPKLHPSVSPQNASHPAPCGLTMEYVQALDQASQSGYIPP